MALTIQTVKDMLKNSLFHNQLAKHSIVNNNEAFYLESSQGEALIPCATINENEAIETLIQLFTHHETVILLNNAKSPVGIVSSAQLNEFLLNSFKQLKAFYDAVIQTSDASVTVIDDNERVCTWTKGAEKIFSVKRHEILGKPITDFFDRNSLEILQTLYEGRSISHQYHQPRPDLFVLINSNPVYFNKRIIGAVVSETDITNQVVLNEKLFNMSTEVHRLEQEVAKYKDDRDPFNYIKGKSIAIQKTIHLARKVCTVKSTVLILGESGVGKEVFAKAIHEASEKPNAPFIPINCGAIPASLFESELFGYERGAFSGADQKGKKGKIELAKGGTLFLDEIGEMPHDMQVKLLRVLQERKYFRIGGEKEIEADIRIIAATNRDLKELMLEGKFREDLYYRLNVVSIQIPPLRERREDIIELTHYFLGDFSTNYKRPIHEISKDIMLELLHYEWPGNIRELRNVIERLVVFATDGVIKKEYLPFTSVQENQSAANANDVPGAPLLSLQEEMELHERKLIERALSLVNGNKLECAKQLGITRATLYNRMNRLNLL
ncbi:sigma-54 interaction domain-containing protein [Bacillus sp. FJAT-27245]|uniref:sigma-54 interaction domain-containing protein n=1 Tax=Bacillus sp. FJAT-27245 TaxID=1684144 RepID=UPI0006A7DE53|nr:sigma-54-dependent Fis family transcriptional regulator [Bacillus sp. FJAT-27245]